MEASAPPNVPETFEPKTTFHRAWESPVRVDPVYESVCYYPNEVKDSEDIQISSAPGVDCIPSPDYTNLGTVTSTPQDHIKPKPYLNSVLKEEQEVPVGLTFDDCQSSPNNETSAAVASIVKENSDMYNSTFAPTEEVAHVAQNLSMNTRDFISLTPSFLCESVKPQNMSYVNESGFHSGDSLNTKTELAIRPDKTDMELNESSCLVSSNTGPPSCSSLSIKPLTFMSPKESITSYQYEEYEKDFSSTKENIPFMVHNWTEEEPQLQSMIPTMWKNYPGLQSTFMADRDIANVSHEIQMPMGHIETDHHWPWMMSAKPWSNSLPFYNTIPNSSVLQPIIPVTTYTSAAQPLLQHQIPNPAAAAATSSWLNGNSPLGKYLCPVENTATVPFQSDIFNASLQGTFAPFEKFPDPRELAIPLTNYEGNQSLKADLQPKSAFTSIHPFEKQISSDSWSASPLKHETLVEPLSPQLHKSMKTVTFSRGRRRKKNKLLDIPSIVPHSITPFSASRLSTNNVLSTSHHQPTEFGEIGNSMDHSFTNILQQPNSIGTFLGNGIEYHRPEIERLLDDPCKPSSRQNKLNPTAINAMEHWYREHIEHPYPSIEEKEELARIGSITLAQVNSWFANRRTRSSNTRPKKVKRHLHERLRVFTKDIERIARGTINGDVLCDQIYTIIEDHLG